ncbi:ribonuclease D [Ferrimonas balearica]|uniref:ribonuclease D n=1 Tax=Ferrimonas balearica TaxID=44012 RepID=UPI001F401FF7|nr:ribonuclease D [Ferrimonas balearica]MBY6016392.1 ribonuclease D [Halomonas denitrificans]MBY6095337.1 ribonuclease D [Ferrimonas balearica]
MQPMPQWQWIDNDDDLAALCRQCRQKDAVALDTEFVRTRTLHAQLGLIQLYDGETLALIDPLEIQDLGPLWQLIADKNVVKVLHSASEDLEIFAYRGGVIPQPLFDTQVAGVLLNLGGAMGYGKLIHHYLGLELDKGEARTDWLKRPLSEKQLTYAAADVYYLLQVYRMMRPAIEEMGRLDWLWQEGERACRGRLKPDDPNKAYLKVKNAWQLKPKQLAVLKSLAAWRLGVAEQKDLALSFVVKDAALLNLARRAPRSMAYLTNMDCLHEREIQRYGKTLLRVIAAADVDNPPEAIDPLGLDPAFRDALAEGRKVVQAVAEREQVALELLGSKKLVQQYVEWVWRDRFGPEPDLTQGWRGELCAEALSQANLLP